MATIDAGAADADAEAWAAAGRVQGELLAVKASVYDPCGFRCSRPEAEPESADYGAYAFTVDGARVRFRVGRTTPTKVGQFVTVWQRSAEGPIRPFDAADPVDLFVIGSRMGEHFGQFVFPRAVLRARGVVSVDGVGGKRGFRVYPPWVVTENRQARAAQAWQVEHFLSIPADGPIDTARSRALYRP
ncbi:MepB family protein [Embleya sp. NBC_00896]|uniref:MepB family protein n=1 Tax=Embleya sp. NBC_00896 TaxID=2975961 RepID=UPI00386B0DFB|nr:MepB family protein [Embleya sp. NBC_00896]